jgi:hypothetical protein
MASKKATPASQASDPIARGLAAGDDDIEAFITRLVRLVRISDFRGEQMCSIDTFVELRKQAILSEFTDWTAERKAKHLGVSPTTLGRRQQHSAYQIIRDRVLEAGKLLSECGSMEQAAKLLEPVFVEKTLDRALDGTSKRDQLSALNEFTARRSAKMTRSPAEDGGAYIPPELIAVLGEAFSEARERRALSAAREAPVIDTVQVDRVRRVDGDGD